jgi:membrane-associated phospholipid phosphatase
MYDPAEPHAGGWRTWVLKSGADVEPPPPVAYGSDAFWKEVDEVRKVAAALTSAQKRIAEDWNLDLGSVTPGGVWNLHAKKLAQEGKLDDARAAQLFAALNAAMMDAFIACWHAKYRWWTERPVTVIREKYDSAFTPHVITPAFPSYVSGHSSASGAAAEVLAAFFPQEATKLHAMAAEASISRLYGGIHFRSDNEQGLALGRRVGALALERIGVRPAQFPAGSAAITR